MRNYARIAQEIQDSIWLITESGMTLILDIFNRRIAGDELTDEQIAVLLQGSEHGSDASKELPYQIQNGMAVLPIYGPIFGKANLMTQLSGATSMEQFRKDFKMAVGDDNVKSILLDIDSPGGTSDQIAEGGEEIYEARSAKPIYALANDQIGSAAYWLATQASHLYGTSSGEVGSIGAFTVHKDQSAADANAGFKYTIISAGKYKTEGNPHEPLSKDGREYRQEVINELNDEFVSAVARGRSVDVDKVDRDYGQGRMVPNKKALVRGMIDGIRNYDELSTEIVSKHPTQISFMMGETPVSGLVINGQLIATSVESEMSNADMEHSDPGTGSPPSPRLREDEDIAITSGSRRGDIPDPWPEQGQNSTPGAPRAMSENANESQFGSTLAQLCTLLGITASDAGSTEVMLSTLVSRVTELKGNDDALRNDVNRQKSFATDYPDEYARMVRAEEREREADARLFVDSIKTFTRVEGDRQVETTVGLSTLVQDNIREYYLNVATGKASLAQFESLMKSVAHGGTVTFGEVGSARVRETVNFGTSSAEDVKNLRETFATVVKEVMTEDGLDFKAALQVAAKRYPDLAEAYRTTTPA